MRLQLYVLREILVNFIFTAAVLSLIGFLSATLVATYRLPGAPPSLVVGYAPILIMYVFPYLLPVSLLVGVVLTYGRLSADNEITAVRAGGVHLWHLLCPSLLVGLLLAGVVLPLVHQVIPRFHYQKSEYLRDAAVQLVRNLNPALRSISTQSFHMEWASYKPPYFYDLLLDVKRPAESGGDIRVQAERAQIDFQGEDLVITLWEVQSLLAGRDGASTAAQSARLTRRIPFEEIAGSRKFVPTKESECSSEELIVKLRRGRAAEPERASYELQRRAATVFSGVLFAAVGVPIGVFMRRGTRLAAFATALLIVLGGYYPIVYLMETLAKEKAVAPTLAAWAANAFLALVACVLLRKLFRI